METAFLQLLKNEPLDIGNRLIFADWLEENCRPEEAELHRQIVQYMTTIKQFSHWPACSVHYGVTLDEYIVTSLVTMNKNLPTYRRLLASWLKFNKISHSNQFSYPRYPKHHLWVADALEGKLGDQVYIKSHVQNCLIKGYAPKKAERELAVNWATVAVISRKPPEHLGLAYTETDQYGHRKHSEIQYLWRTTSTKRNSEQLRSGFLSAMVV
jgi:uncharacterized protein (TIGR02996 family)